MGDRSGIEWTDATWNPVTGCTKVSPGCAHCYAEAVTLRFKRGGPYLPGQSTITLHPDRLDQPSRWQRPRRVFVCSMSDLFVEQVPFAFVDRIVREMDSARQHTFQVLTKRPERMLEYLAWPGRFLGFSTWPSHIWLGVSVENQYWADRRIPLLMQAIPRVRWLSVEPLLKAVDLTPYLEEIDWVVVGGESGPRARLIRPEWVRRILDDCLAAKTPFFFKQWGGRTAKAGGRELDGRTWDEYPHEGALLTGAFLFTCALARRPA